MAPRVDLLTITATELQRLLTGQAITSVEIVQLYLAQIAKHNHAGLKLNAVISVADEEAVLEQARRLDVERLGGKLRGPLHGVPILLKDLCNTVDMPSTCGSYALRQGRPKANAEIFDALVAAGLIVIAKSNLSELGNAKGFNIMAGWSAVGGQTQSPYVRGGVPANATWLSHYGPAGSSSGSAAGVAAGFAPLSMGTESDGSIIMPAARAGLYALKLTPGSVDTRGLQPGAPEFDCVGPFAKTTTDIATLSAIMQRHNAGKYLPLTGSWAGLKLGFVDPTLWRSYPSAIEPTNGFFEQTDSAMFAAQEKIQSLGGKVVKSIPLASFDDITAAMPDFEYMEELFAFPLKRDFSLFLQLFKLPVPQTIEELIEFNNAHADIVFTERNDNQKGLEAMRDCNMTQETYDRNLKALRDFAASNVRSLLKEYDVDVILGPCDSRTGSVGSAAGFPVANLPLGFANFNGRPFSLHMIAPANEEAKILQIMSAWEATFPENVKPPPQLVELSFYAQRKRTVGADTGADAMCFVETPHLDHGAKSALESSSSSF
ncbi:amidase signature domain-containing protein [Lasiosphaeria hispida]|uniref:Amidase signature domain-containing protein n=1 Tax=Lasiosphaeria hispida TaxID=260671 RepID=A0AAJ0MA20_9PEZI|nr:amidase signature domain-containing protein [Lasiosphaeria hispida]